MIIIKKTGTEDIPYEIWIGEFQKHAMQPADLLDLQQCLRETIYKGKDETPRSSFRILNATQYSELFTDGRSTLWIGAKKWHIADHERELLLRNLGELAGE